MRNFSFFLCHISNFEERALDNVQRAQLYNRVGMIRQFNPRSTKISTTLELRRHHMTPLDLNIPTWNYYRQYV